MLTSNEFNNLKQTFLNLKESEFNTEADYWKTWENKLSELQKIIILKCLGFSNKNTYIRILRTIILIINQTIETIFTF